MRALYSVRKRGDEEEEARGGLNLICTIGNSSAYR